MKEEKLDRLIRKTINKDYLSAPSGDFTERVMNTLGVKRSEQNVVTKPLKPKRGLILMIFIYLIIFVSIFFIPGVMQSSSLTNLLSNFQIPSLTQYLHLDNNMSKILIMMISGGWMLLFFDKYIKRFFMR